MLSEDQKKVLLRLARQSVAACFETSLSELDGFSPELAEIRQGVFVSLYKKGELRGCVGHLHPEQNILQAVTKMAQEAAFQDPRFLPLQADEFSDTRFEISFLSPLQRIRSLEEIEPGRHGVWLRKGLRSGVFLPQVWEEFKDRELFMNALCSQKAGLEERCWQDPEVEIFTFTVEIISEQTP